MSEKSNTIRNLKILFLIFGALMAIANYFWYSIWCHWLSLSTFISLAFILSLLLTRIRFVMLSIFSLFIYITLYSFTLYIDGYLVLWSGFLFFGLATATFLLTKFNVKPEKKSSYLVSSFYFATIIFLIYTIYMILLILEYHDIEPIILWFLRYYGPILLFVPLMSYFLYGKISFLFEDKLEKEPKIPEVEPMKKSPEVPTPPEKVSLILQRLLQEKEEWREKLNELKSQKNELIKKGVLTEEIYKQRYEEIMDKLVDIEDKFIQEKMKGGKKK